MIKRWQGAFTVTLHDVFGLDNHCVKIAESRLCALWQTAGQAVQPYENTTTTKMMMMMMILLLMMVCSLAITGSCG